MASFREVLSFLITADGTQAVKEFDKVAKASNASMAATEGASKLSAAGFLRIGAAAGATAVVAGAVMYKAAAAAGDLEKSMSRVEAAFGKSAASVKDFATNARFLSDIDAAKFAADIGEAAKGMGVASDEAARLTPEVVDVASKLAVIKGLDMGTALESVSAALRGEYDATQRLVPALSAARIESEALAESGKTRAKDLTTAEKAQAALNIIIEDGTKIVKGNSEALESQSAKATETAARLKDAWTGFGAGALTVVEPLTGAVLAMSDAFAGLDSSTQKTIGTIGSLAIAGTGIVSVFNLAVGGIMKFNDNLGTIRGKLVDTTGGFTTMGKAAAGIGGAAAIAGLVGIGVALNNMAKDAVGAKAALDLLKEADTGTQRLKLLADAVDKNTTGFDDFADSLSSSFEWIPGMDDRTASVTKTLGGFNFELNRTMAQVKELALSDPGTAIETITALLDVIPKKGGGPALSDFRTQLQGMLGDLQAVAAAKEGDAAVTGLSADANERWSASAADAAVSADDQAKAMEDQIKGFEDLVTNSKDAAQGMRDLAEATDKAGAEGLATSLEQLDTDEVVTGFLDMGDAMKEMQDNSKNLPKTFDALAAATNGYTDEQDAAIKATVEFATSLKAQASQLLASGASTSFVKEFLKKGQQDIIAAGGENWLESLGLTDQQIEIAIKLAGEEEARQRLLLLSEMINQTFPPNVVREINLRASTGDFTGALLLAQAEMVKLQVAAGEINIDANADGVVSEVEFVNHLMNTGIIDPEVIPIDANKDGVVDEVEAANFLLMSGIKTPPTVPITANGSQVTTETAKVKEHLASIPKNVPVDIYANVDMSKINAAKQAIRELKESSLTSLPVPPAGPTPTPHGGTVNVYLPAGINGRDVERTMRRYAARNGVRVR